MESEGTRQLNNVLPPRASATPGLGVTAITVTTSASVVDLYEASDNQIGNNLFERYLTVVADGADVYWATSMLSSTVIDPTVNGTTVSAGTTAVVPGLLKNGVPVRIRLDVNYDRYLCFKGVGSATVRIYPSSQPKVEYASY
jgi:hypothetical protein